MQTTARQPEVSVADTTLLSLIPGIINIGRATDNDVQIDEPDISQYHARIVTYFGQSYIIDLSGEGNALLNGERVTKHAIKPGDVITLGKHHIIIKAPSKWFY